MDITAPEVTPVTGIEAFRPSTNLGLSTALLGIESTIEALARANVDDVSEGYLPTEIEAMVLVEELKLVNGMDLAAVLLRGKLIKKIEEGSYWTVHPGQYNSLQSMARDQGISVSNLSNIKDLCFVIFPWIEAHGQSIPDVFEKIGMSNLREIIPMMKCLISGEDADAASVQASIDRVLDDVAATAVAGGELITPEEARDLAIDNLLTQAEHTTNRELRQVIRPERTPSINLNYLSVPNSDNRILYAEVTEDQYIMLQRRLHGYMDPFETRLPNDGAARSQEARRIPVLRRIMELIEG